MWSSDQAKLTSLVENAEEFAAFYVEFAKKVSSAALEEREDGMDVDVDDNDDRDKQSGKQETEKAGEKGTENDGESAMEVDDDTGFLTHRLYFPKDNNEEIEKAERDYEVIDPRQRSARAREEERERKKRIKPRDGGRGFRR